MIDQITYNSWKVGSCWQQEHVVQTVDDVLWLNILFGFILSSSKKRSIHADVSHTLHHLFTLSLILR